MNRKDKITKSLEQGRAVLDKVKEKEAKDSQIEELKLKQVTEQVTKNKNKGNTMKNDKLSKLQSAKSIVKAVARTTESGHSVNADELFDTYVKAASDDYTTGNAGAELNNVIDPVLRIDFDPKLAETELLSKMTKVPMAGKNSEKVFFGGAKVKLHSVAEGADIRTVAQHSMTFRSKTLSLTRAAAYAALTFELKEKSIFDVVSLIQGAINSAVPEQMFDAVLNGSSNATFRDAGADPFGLTTDSLRAVIGQGARATCIELGSGANHAVAVGAALTRQNVSDFLAGAGPIADAKNNKGWMMLMAQPEKAKLTTLKRSSLGDKLDVEGIYESEIYGVPFRSVYAFPAATHTDGLVNLTGGNNTKGSILFIDLSCINYAIENADLSVEYVPYTRKHMLCLNIDLGVVVMTDAANQNAKLAINITRS